MKRVFGLLLALIANTFASTSANAQSINWETVSDPPYVGHGGYDQCLNLEHDSTPIPATPAQVKFCHWVMRLLYSYEKGWENLRRRVDENASDYEMFRKQAWAEIRPYMPAQPEGTIDESLRTGNRERLVGFCDDLYRYSIEEFMITHRIIMLTKQAEREANNRLGRITRINVGDDVRDDLFEHATIFKQVEIQCLFILRDKTPRHGYKYWQKP